MSKRPTTGPSRREFLKTSSVAATSATLLGSAALSSRAFAADDDVIKIGLIGCGGRGRGACAQALKTEGNVKLVAMGDAFEDQLETGLKNISNSVKNNDTAHIAVDKDHKFVGFDAYKQVLESDVDLVILATPPGFRPIHFEAAVNAGKHVFMEKPVATDAPGVQKVLNAAKAAKEKNLKVGVGLQRRHQQCYLDMINRIHDGAIGDVIALRVYWNGGGVWDPRKSRDEVATEMEYQMRNWYYYNWLCGDHICEQHIHNLDVGNWIMGGFPVKAQGVGGREVRTDPKYGQIFDHHMIEYTFENGEVMISECRHIRNCWNEVSEHAHGSKGIAHLDNSARARNVNIEPRKGSGTEAYEFRGEAHDPYQTEHDDLFAALRKGESYSEAEYGAMSTMTAILGRMATYSGSVITMADAMAKGRDIMPKEYAWDAKPPVVPNDQGVYPVPVPGVTKVLS